jgi:hypothetical protein
VAIAVVKHAALNLAKADGLPIRGSAHSHRLGSRCGLGQRPTSLPIAPTLL